MSSEIQSVTRHLLSEHIAEGEEAALEWCASCLHDYGTCSPEGGRKNSPYWVKELCHGNDGCEEL